MANKKKVTTSIVAGVTAVALVIGGTFAWTSINQQAQNEAGGIVNVGGRLHDDFTKVMSVTYAADGTTIGYDKDIYVENFTDPLNGGQPIYARIRLDEYMEIGQDAGGYGEDVDGDSNINAVPVIDGTDIRDPSTWTTHIPAQDCAACDAEGTCRIHDHWTWAMGNAEAKVFMPTFNKDKDSLKADINGTYAGTNLNDKIYYDDYVVYTTDNTAGAVNFADKESYDGAIYSVTGTAYYDDDTDTAENDHETPFGVRVETESHTAKNTGTAEVMTMAEWQAAGGEAGDFWVYDTDGWAYWANPIMPGEATGLLLDGFTMKQNPGEKCYYAINVVGQFSTVGDWEKFYTDDENTPDISEDAKAVLEAAAANVTVVAVNNDSDTTTVDPGATVNFSATASTGGTKDESATFTWAVYDADLKPVTISTISEDGVLTVGAAELNKNLIIVATDKDSGAVGMSSIAVNVVLNSEIALKSIPIEGFMPGNTISFIINDGASLPDGVSVVWSASDKDGKEIAGISINENGELTIADSVDEGTQVYVKVILKVDDEIVSQDECDFTVGPYKYFLSYPRFSNDEDNFGEKGEVKAVAITHDGSGGRFFIKDKDTDEQYSSFAMQIITDSSQATVSLRNSEYNYGMSENLKDAIVFRTYKTGTVFEWGIDLNGDGYAIGIDSVDFVCGEDFPHNTVVENLILGVFEGDNPIPLTAQSVKFYSGAWNCEAYTGSSETSN